MENRARNIVTDRPFLEYGEVTGEDRGTYRVLTGAVPCPALPAFGCVVKPEKGDRVLLSTDASGRTWILSVLERPGGEARGKTFLFDGPVTMTVRNGGLRMSADNGLSMASDREITLAAQRVGIDAKEGEARIETMSFLGSVFQGRVETIRIVAHAVDSIIRRAVQRLTSSYRYVEEHEEIQSASTRMLVDGTLTMQTKNTMHTAEGHVKIDAEQIHLG